MNDAWWRYPVVSGTERDSGFSGLSGVSRIDAALAEAFPAPDAEHVATMSTGGPVLSADDQALVDQVKRQMMNVVSQIKMVVECKTNAFFIWGPGGHGKSFVVRKALDMYRCDAKITTTAASAKGLFDRLRKFPTDVHVFEDMESIFKRADCQSILRAACGGQSTKERKVCWATAGKADQSFEFEGGIIIISNVDPSGRSLKLGAIASRFAPQEWKLTNTELAAMIRDIAINTPCPFGRTAEERLEVADYVIAGLQKGSPVELRTFREHAMPAFAEWARTPDALVHWKEVVNAKITGGPKRSHSVVQRERLMETASAAHCEGKDTQQRVEYWRKDTGLSQSQFYEYLKEAKEEGIYTKVKAKIDRLRS